MRHAVLAIALFAACDVLLSLSPAAMAAPPKSLDPRLQVELFAEAPQIVTPTGIAVDARGRVLVIESHTHFRPKNYQGPAADRILLMEDGDGDGRAERIGVFFEGSHATMNLAVDHDGSVLVATRNEVFRLRDTDGDDRADQRTRLVFLDTKGDYPHNGLSGFAFDLAGHVYFGLGENLGADYKLIGSDGATLAGGGEGGGVFRCRADGSELTQLATGFWNPFHLARDAFGRLFAVDNDPDWRPPCRLLHIVPGGDYGYRFRNGRRGTHPFTSWFGQLPGTLGMVAGTGEAPSGLVAYESDGLPEEYRGDLLATSWGFHAIQRYRLRPRGATFQSAAETIVKGDENFRPVGIALAPDGSLLVSDWVDRSYQLHGRGRVWRISAVDPPKLVRPKDPAEAIASPHGPLREQAARKLLASGDAGLQTLHERATGSNDPRVRAIALEALATRRDGAVAAVAGRDTSADVQALTIELAPPEQLAVSRILAKLAAADQPPLVRAAAARRLDPQKHTGLLLKIAGDDDPFLAQAARRQLERLPVDALLQLGLPRDAGPRRAVALLLRQCDDPKAAQLLDQLLADGDGQVRLIAVQWVGEKRLRKYRDALLAGLRAAETPPELLDAYLAALDLVDGQRDAAAFESQQEQVIAGLLDKSDLPEALLVKILRRLRSDHPAWTASRFERLLASESLPLRIEAVRTLRESGLARRSELLTNLAEDSKAPAALRAEAAAALDAGDDRQRRLLFALAGSDEASLRAASLRTLQSAPLQDGERAIVEKIADDHADSRELAGRLLAPQRRAKLPEAGDVDAWMKQLAGAGDAPAGERLFFAPQGPRCYVCHQHGGRGGAIGPDLSGADQMERRRIVESILQPAREVAPQYVTWSLILTDGTTHSAMLVTEKGDDQVYADDQGRLRTLRRQDIEDRRPQSISIMPERLVDTLSVQDFRDLLAFLTSASR